MALGLACPSSGKPGSPRPTSRSPTTSRSASPDSLPPFLRPLLTPGRRQHPCAAVAPAVTLQGVRRQPRGGAGTAFAVATLVTTCVVVNSAGVAAKAATTVALAAVGGGGGGRGGRRAARGTSGYELAGGPDPRHHVRRWSVCLAVPPAQVTKPQYNLTETADGADAFGTHARTTKRSGAWQPLRWPLACIRAARRRRTGARVPAVDNHHGHTRAPPGRTPSERTALGVGCAACADGVTAPQCARGAAPASLTLPPSLRNRHRVPV